MVEIEETISSKLKVAMFPWFAFGHSIPFMHLSNKLAEKGHQISFLLPKKAMNQLIPLNLHQNLINFHPLTVPQIDGLPPGTETASDVPIHLHNLLAVALDHMQDQVKELLKNLNPDVVFYDFAFWIPKFASEIGFKSVNFIIISAAAIAHGGSRNGPNIIDGEYMYAPPGYPSSACALTHDNKREAKELCKFMNLEFGIDGITFHKRQTTSLLESDIISIRTCRELEGPFCDYLSREYNKPVLLTGPLLPEPGKQQCLEDHWIEWLDKFEAGTVVVCAFGSQSFQEKKQFQEMLLGFELTGYPFLVVLKPPIGVKTVEEAFPEGFEERNKGKGIVFGKWLKGLPDLLNHPSVGCYVNHCGYGTMWESLMSDKQIVLIPQLLDQKLGTNLLSKDLNVAVAVEVEEEEDNWVSKENLCKAIKSVMDPNSNIGRLVKHNHSKLREIIGKPSFTNECVETFIQNLKAELRS